MQILRLKIIPVLLIAGCVINLHISAQGYTPDLGNGMYRNPLIYTGID